ncbi:MAG: sialidase family protein [Bryobacteraceae bacterium]|nr:sialidase family protein [Bryobacteraceae bacterium]
MLISRRRLFPSAGFGLAAGAAAMQGSGAAAPGASSIDWSRQVFEDSVLDSSTVVFDGKTPNRLACNTNLRKMPDGTLGMTMLGGGDSEPLPENNIFLTWSHDQGKTWSDLKPLLLGFKEKDRSRALVPPELMVHQGRCWLFFYVHDGKFGEWSSWYSTSEDSGHTWSKASPIPGELHRSTAVRNHLITAKGAIMLPFQHYLAERRNVNPRNGVLTSSDGGKSFQQHGWIRVSDDDQYVGWTEPGLFEHSNGAITMLLRRDGSGVLYRADSPDGGKTWPTMALPTAIPNPGSKFTVYPLGGERVALLHNPHPKTRNPLSLWVSFDGMETWPYRRDLVRLPPPPAGSRVSGAFAGMSYPDGFVSEDRAYLHFAYDERRSRAIYYAAKLPPLPA